MKRTMLISFMCVIFILPVAAITYAAAPYDIAVTVNGTPLTWSTALEKLVLITDRVQEQQVVESCERS